MRIYSNLKFITFLFLFSCFFKAKANDTLYFVGNIYISKSVSYKYNLRFTISNDKKVSGYSLTDPGGANETKTKITGTFDTTTKILKYEETTLLRSKVDMQKSNLCFVKATLKIKKNKFFETLVGNFQGIEHVKNTTCATGDIKLLNTDRIKKVLKDQADKEEFKIQKKQEANAKYDRDFKIAGKKGKEFMITGNTIKLTVWDRGAIDGDSISIQLNGKYILQNYSLTSTPKILNLDLADMDVNTLKIIANNEGTLPPNTAAIKIETSLEQYPILTEAKINEDRTIILRKKK
jgi:hypothetical protein